MSYLPFDALSPQLPLEADFLFHPQPPDDSKPQNSLFSRLLNRSTALVNNIRNGNETAYRRLQEETDDEIILSEEEKPLLLNTIENMNVSLVAFHPTALLMAVCVRYDNTVKLWKLTKKINLNLKYKWSATCVATLRGHSDGVNCVAFHPTAPLLATGSQDNTAKLWRLSSDNSSATCVATLRGHSSWVRSVAFHPTAPLLATGSEDKTAKLWRLSSNNSSATCVATLKGHGDSVCSVAFHPTAPLLATGSWDYTAKLWRLSSDNSSATCVATLSKHSSYVNYVAFHPTAPLLATGSSDYTAKLWRLDFILAEPAFIFGFLKNLVNLYYVFNTINEPTLYKLSNKEDFLKSLPNKRIQFPDRLDHQNRKLMITKARMSAMLVQKLLINYTTGPPIDIIKFATSILSRLRRRPKNLSATCVATLEGHSDSVFSVAFHATAPLLATGSLDNTAKLWRLSSDNSSATCVATLEGHSGYVMSVAFHPTVPLLATGSWDRTAKLFEISKLLLRIKPAPQGGGLITRHHKKRLSRKVKRYASKRIKKNRNRNKYQKSKKAKTKTKTRRYRKIR
jgi:WD40 repeat protein